MKRDVLPFCRPMMCYHFERFTLGCSWHYKKDVRRTRKIREKRGKAGESFEAIAVWVEMKKTGRVQSDRDSWREKVWQGMWNQTHHGGSNKEWLLALPVLGSCWIIQCCCPFTEAWASLSALCPEQGGAATHIPALRASHPDKFTPSFPAGVQRSFIFPSSCNSVVLWLGLLGCEEHCDHHKIMVHRVTTDFPAYFQCDFYLVRREHNF